MAGDYKRFLERDGEDSVRLLICVYCLSYAPALLTLKMSGQDTGGGARLLFFFVLIVQLSDASNTHGSQLPNKHVIVPAINTTRTWEGLLRRNGQRDVGRRHPLLGHALQRRVLVDVGRDVGGDLPDGLRRQASRCRPSNAIAA